MGNSNFCCSNKPENQGELTMVNIEIKQKRIKTQLKK